MPRFTPWYSGAPPDASQSDALIETVLRPGLRLAFPLAGTEQDKDELFGTMLDHLTQASGSKLDS